MEIKYDAVFGPQELFDGAPDDAEMVYETANHVRGYYKKCNSLKFFSNGKWVRVLNEKAMIIHAMRRIIRTPIWTVEDQKAGRLPEVLAKVDGGVVVFVNSFNVVTELESGAVIVSSPKTFLNTFKPIESPEEKAARLREEWVEKAVGATPVYEISVHGYGTQLRIDISSIYDALLSGELKMPEVQK